MEEIVFSGCSAQCDGASVAVFTPVFRGERPGAQLRRASAFIETYSPYQREDISGLRIADAGDIDLPDDLWQATDTLEAYAGSLLDRGTMPVMLSSDHSLSYGCIRAAAARSPELRVIHFGSDAELKREGLGGPEMSIMRRVWEMLGDRRIFQFGIRSGSRDEFEWGVPPRIRMERFSARGIDSCAEMVANMPVYITIDLSVVDPSSCGAVARPNPGGMTFNALHDALMTLRGLDTVAFDITGYRAPLDGPSMASAAVVCKLARELLAAFA